MDISILRQVGLTESQAKGYIALIEHDELTPAELAGVIGESRTNSYAIIDKLVRLGLALQKTGSSKQIFHAAHPSALEALAERRRKAVTQSERLIKNNLGGLIDLFYQTNETPGTRTLYGPDGIKALYNETLADKHDIYLIRTIADSDVVGSPFLKKYREERAALGIHTYALTPKTPNAITNQSSGMDEKLLYHRHFFPNTNSYTAPVEIDIFGDKAGLIAFGRTQTATIINSPAIALALRQLTMLMIHLIAQQAHPND